jgi:hypothetical protein
MLVPLWATVASTSVAAATIRPADAEVGHIPDPLILNRRPVCNRICERAFRSMVPKLIARDPWNDSAAACKARVAMRGLR